MTEAATNLVTSARSQRSRSLVEVATAALREQILCGHLAPGERVHLQEAAERLQMSPGPVREALRTLAGEGLVVALPQRGYRVTVMSRHEFEDIYRWRAVLDPQATREATSRLSDRQIQEMGRHHVDTQDARRRQSWDQYHLDHRRFHLIPFEACQSAWLRNATISLWDASVRYQVLAGHQHRMTSLSADQHDQLLDAFRARDPERVAELTSQQIQATVDTIDAMPAGTLE